MSPANKEDLKEQAGPLASISRDAERWRALVSSGRVRVLGSANLGSSEPQHIGLDLWESYSGTNQGHASSVEELTLYVDTIRGRGRAEGA